MNLKKVFCLLISIQLILSYGMPGFLVFIAEGTSTGSTTYTSLATVTKLEDGDIIDGASITTETVNITLSGTVTVVGTINITGDNAKLTISGKGRLERGSKFKGRMFNVDEDGTLIIEGNDNNNQIIIDGGIKWNATSIENSTRKKFTLDSSSSSRDNITGAAISVGSSSKTVGNVDLKYVTMQNLYTCSQETAKNLAEENNTKAEDEKDNTIESPPQASAINVTGDTVSVDNPLDSNYSKVNMNNVIIQSCATLSDKSITLFNDCVANLENCNYQNNYSGNCYAGTIKAGGSNYFSQLYMEGCIAEENYSSGWGGVLLWAANGDTTASENNGNILNSKATIKNCRFESNTARWLGGAISNEGVIEIEETTILYNTAMAGGGIAVFPYTRDKSDNGNDDNSTLLKNVTIKNNKAKAGFGYFKPFSIKTPTGDEELADDITLADNLQVSYPGGGGGIWCYMNMADWEYTFKLSEGNEIIGNSTEYFGGGVYIDVDAKQNIENASQASVESTTNGNEEVPEAGENTKTLIINGATISGNKAVNGGGVATNDVKVEFNSGTINNNTATGNGGGLYLDENSTLELKTSGLIVGNQATGTTEAGAGTLMKDDVYDNELVFGGVGGGVFLKNGSSFIVSSEKNKIGIHSNTANTAADDVYAYGTDTKLNLPDVTYMNLTGYNSTITPDGWYADYMENDTSYPSDVISSNNPGRYRGNDTKVQVENSILQSNQNAFYCLTLGYGLGTLTINKTYTGERENQSSIFRISNSSTSFSMDVSILPGKKSVTITSLPYGEYTVEELTYWSWNYTVSSESSKITLSNDNTTGKIEFTNTLKDISYLSGDNSCKNIWTPTLNNDGSIKSWSIAVPSQETSTNQQ